MDLRDLWRRRIRSILNVAAEGETDHREISNLAAHIGADGGLGRGREPSGAILRSASGALPWDGDPARQLAPTTV